MQDLSLSLLREKLVIHDPKVGPGRDKKPVIALSNRIAVELTNNKGKLIERLVVRAQNMHSCTRVAAHIVQSFIRDDALLDRPKPFDWDSLWNSVVSDYEYAFNPSLWGAVYSEGKVVFQSGYRHPLLDLIEKCDAENEGKYEESIPIAEDAFKKTGKVVKIEYDGNVALVVNLKPRQGRCGIILRGADRTTTFNFSTAVPKQKTLSFPRTLNVAAAFLEGIQLAFMVGMNNVKTQMGHIERHSREEKQTREAKKRLSRLNTEIVSYENSCDVRYRPEKPDFQRTILEAEALAKKIIKPAKGSDLIA